MAVSTVGSGYQFLPPVIRPDPNPTSGTPADASSGGTTAAGGLRVAAPAAPAPAAPARDDTDAGRAGKHLLRIVV